jgi:hypothetical protein
MRALTQTHYGVGEGFDQAGEFEDLDVVRAVIPVVAPAHNYIAAGHGMAVVAEVLALKFKFDVHALPRSGPT